MRTFLNRVKTAILGAPIATESERPVAVRTRVAFAIFGIGMLSSVAYAPDAVIEALRGGGLTSAGPWMAGGVVLLMLLLGFAYRDNVRQRHDERADYGLVREKLGATAGLVTGASLLVDYLFTVAVSVAALAQFAHYLLPITRFQETVLALLAILVMTLLSLRGVRTRARLLVVVTVAFLVVIVGLLVFSGILGPALPEPAPVDHSSAWTVVIAFAGAIASGSVMMTGIESLAASGPFHAAPQGVRAGRTLMIAVTISALAFFTVSWLVWHFSISGWVDGPAVLQVSDKMFSASWPTWIIGAAAIAILYAAASAVFRRFAGLSSLLASDSYLPRQLAMRNDRLVYRGGVLTIAIASAVVVLAARADLQQLIHMYVIGVFTSIVLSQVAMVRLMTAKIALETEPRELFRLTALRALHMVAAIAAAAVWLIVAVFNFFNGAWIAIGLMVILVIGMRAIQVHYAKVRQELRVQPHDPASALPSATHGVVLVAQLHRPALRAIAYAKASRHTTLTAIGVKIEAPAARELQRRWTELNIGVPLVILDSPYRDIVGPVMEYVKSVHRESPRDVVVMYVPEYIVGRWWEQFLHNRSTSRLRSLLLRTPGVVVAAVPWHLESAADQVVSFDSGHPSA
ncbi:APC family permease [Demequina sp.]|uniref:APC family permease n=1 Tax=Demequina sp. TaxID=2050685 RepID=UPI003D13B1A3